MPMTKIFPFDRGKYWKGRAINTSYAQGINVREQISVIFVVKVCTIDS